MCFGREVLENADVLQVGDLVSLKFMNRMVNYFLPITVSKDCLQLRGQNRQRIDRQTNETKRVYPTFRALSKNEWYYCGKCFLGENIERGDDIDGKWNSCMVGLGIVM